jgi:hypothetical protein
VTSAAPNPAGFPRPAGIAADNGDMTAVPVESLAAASRAAARARAGEPLDLRTAVEQLGRDQFRRALIRRFIRAQVDDPLAGSRPVLVTQHPHDAADVVMGLIDALLGL